MKIAHISTINTLKTISASGDIEFCLAPYCENLEYKRYFQKSHRYTIIDNGVAENILISDKELVGLAVEMKIREIIIPDVISDYKKTKKQRNIFLKKYYDILNKNNIKIMAVIQGNNIDEYEKSLREVSGDCRIDVIGIPFRMNYTIFKNKTKEENQMLNRLIFLQLFQFFKPVHCLGCNLPEELKLLSYINKVRSCDTKLIARYGINDKVLSFNDKAKPTKKLDIKYRMNIKEINCALKNINKLKEVIKWEKK